MATFNAYLPVIEDLLIWRSSVSSSRRHALLKSKAKTALGTEDVLHIRDILSQIYGAEFATLPICETVVIWGNT